MNTDTYKHALTNEKEELESELSSMGTLNAPTDEWVATPEAQTAPEADENDLADRSEDFEGRSGMTEVLSARLTDIKIALQKIETGTYGICEVCHTAIEEDRLSANPAART